MPETRPTPAKRAPPRSPPRRHFTRAPKSRGPKDRPILRLEQHATWRVRMRAWCNTIKSALLGPIHNPLEPQTYRVIQQPHCPISNASTWLIWWNGDAVPRPSHIASVERLIPGSTRLLALQDVDTPLQRNLYAIDLLRVPVHSIATAQRERGEPAWRLLRTISRIWCGNLELAAAHLRAIRRGALPDQDISALLEYSALEPASAFRYLMRLATSSTVGDGVCSADCGLDLISAAMAVRTLAEVANIPGPPTEVLGLGSTMQMIALASQVFWTSPHEFDEVLFDLHAHPVFGASTAHAVEALFKARDAYFEHYKLLGVPEVVIRNLVHTHHALTPGDAFCLARARF